MRVISASDCQAALEFETLIGRLRDAFRRGATAPGSVSYDMPRLSEPPSRLTLAAAWRGEQVAGVRIETETPGNLDRHLPARRGTYLLLDGRTGAPRALLDGPMLRLRAAAACSALAASYLARPDCGRLLVIGASVLASHMVAAFAAVRPLRAVLIWDQRPEEARRLAQALDRRRLKVDATRDLPGALAGADVICSVVDEPVLRGADLHPGQHVSLLGDFAPACRQADDEALARARIFLDDRATGALTSDLAEAVAAGALEPTDIAADLTELARGERAGRRFYQQITLFKSAGTDLEDLAAAQLAWERA